MTFVFQERYKPHVEERMRAFWETLSERDRRRFAAIEAAQLGHGGIEYLAEVLGCSTRTIERGADEIDQLPTDPAAGRVRRPASGLRRRPPKPRDGRGAGAPPAERAKARIDQSERPR